MESSFKSAGMPGAPSCSEGQQAMIPATLVVDLFSGVSGDLAAALELIRQGLDEPEGHALSGAMALVAIAGAAVDRAVRALGGSVWDTQDRWLFAPAASQALDTLEGRGRSGGQAEGEQA